MQFWKNVNEQNIFENNHDEIHTTKPIVLSDLSKLMQVSNHV